ncbi:DUF2474 domain-containing protein [Aureimonas sp. SK2]|uniref:DUF2474 domain-containing protein n=1 Tax=Aureimonas sp. SK2 TaxID=3015992 RepID=UPI00325FF3C9
MLHSVLVLGVQGQGRRGRVSLMSEGANAGPWWKRLLWLIAIWALSVSMLGTVAMIIRFWLKA